MRLQYETEASRNEDLEILQRLEKHFGIDRYKIIPTSIGCRFDAFVCHAREKLLGERYSRSVVALLELKKRRHPYGSYGSVIISLSKWQYLQSCRGWAMKPRGAAELRENRDTPVDIVIGVQWSDCLGYYKFDEMHDLKIEEKAGRTKATRDEWDIEDVVHLPIELFDLVN